MSQTCLIPYDTLGSGVFLISRFCLLDVLHAFTHLQVFCCLTSWNFRSLLKYDISYLLGMIWCSGNFLGTQCYLDISCQGSHQDLVLMAELAFISVFGICRAVDASLETATWQKRFLVYTEQTLGRTHRSELCLPNQIMRLHIYFFTLGSFFFSSHIIVAIFLCFWQFFCSTFWLYGEFHN